MFQSTGNKPQRPAWIQLAVYLHRVGGLGRGHLSTSHHSDVGAGTVFLYTNRVIIALSNLQDRFVIWPTGDYRNEVRNAFAAAGFDGCIGSIDGTLMRLEEAPSEHTISYYCRKKFYGVRR